MPPEDESQRIPNPWNQDNIAPESTFTSDLDLLRVQRDLAQTTRLVSVGKSGSQLEIWGENPNIVINTLDIEKASIWYGLATGLLVDLVADPQKKTDIQHLLSTHFAYCDFPVIPIINNKNNQPKFKVRDAKVRMYSLFGGANLRSFLKMKKGSDSLTSHYRDYESFLSAAPKLLAKLSEQQLQLDPVAVSHEVATKPRLHAISLLLDTVEDLKQQVADSQQLQTPETKTTLIHLEFLARCRAIVTIFDELHLYHGHSGAGNMVTTWSETQFEPDVLKSALIAGDSRLHTDLDGFVQSYPHSYLNIFQIDLDQASYYPNMSRFKHDPDFPYQLERVKALTHSVNPLERMLGFKLLAITDYDDQHFETLFSSAGQAEYDCFNYKVIEAKVQGFDWKTIHTTLEHTFSIWKKSQTDVQAGSVGDHTLDRVEETATSCVPSISPEPENRIFWNRWIKAVSSNDWPPEYRSWLVQRLINEYKFTDIQEMTKFLKKHSSTRLRKIRALAVPLFEDASKPRRPSFLDLVRKAVRK